MRQLISLILFSLTFVAHAEVACQRAAVKRVAQIIGKSLVSPGADHILTSKMSYSIYNAAIGKNMLIETYHVSINDAETMFFHQDVAYPTYGVTTTMVDGLCRAARNVQGPYDFIPAASQE